MFILNLKIDVMPKQRPRFGKGGNVYTPTETKNCMKMLGMLYTSYMSRKCKTMIPKGQPIKISFRIQTTRKRGKSDIDNYLKTILDAGNKILWHDDSWITEIGSGRMEYNVKEPQVLLKVEEIKE
jgi:crossover junction endodeoxyribonuclease RusA